MVFCWFGVGKWLVFSWFILGWCLTNHPGKAKNLGVHLFQKSKNAYQATSRFYYFNTLRSPESHLLLYLNGKPT